MSFFETASLVLISDFAAASASAVSGSGTSTGKAYSIKPTDGSGDFDFERGSDITATRVNPSGLIEKGRGNFLLQSNNFDTTWVKSSVNLTGSQSGYDGSNDAWILRKTGTTGAISQEVASLTNLQTFSIYAKPGDLNWIRIIRAGKSIYVDLENQVTGSVGGGVIDVKVIPINEWSRISLTINETSINTVIYPADGDDDISGTSGFIYIQDAQLEPGLVATDYIETTTAPLRAGLLEDEPRFDYHNSASATPNTCPSLLLEPERTNLITNSEYFDSWNTLGNGTVTQNYGISPEGVQNSSRFQAVTTSDRIYISMGTVNANETFSVYMKGSGPLLIDVGGGNNFYPNLTSEWVRYEFTTSQNGTNGNIQFRGNNGTLDVELYGAQFERNSYATSYIPTYGTAATRGNDLCELSTGGVNETEGTFFIDYKDSPNRGALFASSTSHNLITNNIRLSDDQLFIKNGGGNLIVANVTTPDSGKLALKYSTSGVKLFANGGSTPIYESTTSITFNGSIDYVRVGSRVNDASVQEFRVKQFLIFPEALSDAECITLTTL